MKLARPLLFLALMALAVPRAEASISRAAGPALASTNASPSIERSLTLEEVPRLEPRFDLFAGDELAASQNDRAQSFHPLAAVSLISKDGAEGPLVSADELSYPKIRVWAIDVLGSILVSRSSELSLETHWACSDFSCGLASGGRKDPLGLAEQTPEMKDQQCRVTGIGCTAHHDGGALVSFLGGAAEGGAVSGAALLVFSGMSLACGPAYGACFAGLTVGTLANVGVQNAASRIEAGQTAGQAAAGGAATAVGLAPGYAAVTNRDIVTQQDLGMTPEERARMGGQLAGAVAVGATVGPRLASKTAPKPAAAPAPKPAGARGVQVHQEVAAEYVARGGQDLGFGHATTDVNVGGPGTPEVSIVTVDLAGSSVSRSVPTGRTHPLTSKLTTKAWRSSVDPNVGPNRILHAELYGPEPPTPAQLRAIQAAQQEAASWADPVTIVFGYRK